MFMGNYTVCSFLQGFDVCLLCFPKLKCTLLHALLQEASFSMTDVVSVSYSVMCHVTIVSFSPFQALVISQFTKAVLCYSPTCFFAWLYVFWSTWRLLFVLLLLAQRNYLYVSPNLAQLTRLHSLILENNRFPLLVFTPWVYFLQKAIFWRRVKCLRLRQHKLHNQDGPTQVGFTHLLTCLYDIL